MNTDKKNIESIEELPYSMKGYELYVWKENNIKKYKLVTGTNLQKEPNQILKKEFLITDYELSIITENDFELNELIKKLPKNSEVILNYGKWWDNTKLNKNITAINDTLEIMNILSNNKINLIK